MIMVITNIYIIGTGYCIEKELKGKMTVNATVNLFMNYLIDYYKFNIIFELSFRS